MTIKIKFQLTNILKTVEPVLSSHPRGMAKRPLNTGCTEYASNTIKMVLLTFD